MHGFLAGAAAYVQSVQGGYRLPMPARGAGEDTQLNYRVYSCSSVGIFGYLVGEKIRYLENISVFENFERNWCEVSKCR